MCISNLGAGDVMQIFVQTGAGKHITIMVRPSDTVEHIKAKIKREQGVPTDEQFTLSLDGKLLEDGCMVSSYSIQNGSTLFGSRGIIFCVSGNLA